METNRLRVKAVFRWAALALFFALGAVGSTWPLATQLGTGIPLGTEVVATVPLFNLWTLAWNAESLPRGYAGYWQAPIFHPTPDAFALSEPQPIAGLIAAVIVGLGGSILVAYNLILIGALALNGWLSVCLLRQVRLSWPAALAGGAMVLLLPFIHQELGVLQLVPLAGVLLFAMAVLRFASDPGVASGMGCGVTLAVAYGLSAQVAVFTALSSVPAVLWLWWPNRRRRRAWVGATAGGVLFLLLIAPLAVAQSRATADAGFARSVETVRKQSARPVHYLTSPWPTLVPAPGIGQAETPSRRAFWPGSVRVVLAVFGILLARSRPDWRRPAVAASLLLATSVLLSFGARLGIDGFSLLDILRPLPGLAQIRSFFRFALLAQLAVVALAAGALHLVWQRVEERSPHRWRTFWVAAVAVLAVIEMRPAMGEIAPLPPLNLDLPWVSWIERETTPGEVLAFVPFPEGRSSRAYLGTSQWMYWQIRHGRPMVNGYSGFFPASFRSLKKSMETFPAIEALQALHEAGVRYCIVHRRVIESSPPPDPNAPIRLVQIFRDEQHGLAIFELRRGSRPPRTRPRADDG